MMSRRAAVSAIDLIHGRGFLNRWSHKSGLLFPSFSLFSSDAFQRKPSIDFRRVKELKDSIELFHKMKSMRPEPSVRMYNNLMSITAKIEQYCFALYMFDEMLRMGVAVDNYTMTIAVNCCCLLKDIHSAFAIMGFFFKRGYEPDTVTFNTLIKGLFSNDQDVEAAKLFEKVLDLKLCKPDGVMILHMIDGLCKAGQIIAAHYCLHRLKSSGWRPNVMAYNALIDGFCKCGNVDDAFQFLFEMAKMEIKPNIITYNILIKGYCKTGNLDEAWHVFDEISQAGLRHSTVSYNTMIQGLIRQSTFSDGWKLFEDMEAHKRHPDRYTYNILLDGLCRIHRINEALALMKVMEARGKNPGIVTYNVLINGLCKGGRLDDAIMLFNHLPSKGLNPNAHTYNMMLDSLYHEGREGEARRLMVEMERSGCALDGVTFNIIVWNLVNSNKMREAIPFLQEMCRRGYKVNSEIISGLLHELRIGEGKDEKLQEIVKSSKSTSECSRLLELNT